MSLNHSGITSKVHQQEHGNRLSRFELRCMITDLSDVPRDLQARNERKSEFDEAFPQKRVYQAHAYVLDVYCDLI